MSLDMVEMNFKLWFEENSLTRVPLERLLMHRSSMFRTMQDAQANRGTRTTGPVMVAPVNDNFLLFDGYHRVFENMLQGADSVLARVHPVALSTYSVPEERDRLKYDSRLRYKGLENLADESILKDIRKILGK